MGRWTGGGGSCVRGSEVRVRGGSSTATMESLELAGCLAGWLAGWVALPGSQVVIHQTFSIKLFRRSDCRCRCRCRCRELQIRRSFRRNPKKKKVLAAGESQVWVESSGMQSSCLPALRFETRDSRVSISSRRCHRLSCYCDLH